MSQKRSKHEIPGIRPNKTNGGKKNAKNVNSQGSNHKEKIVRKLYDTFKDNFDLALIISVAHTCQWDINRATEALMILGGRKDLKKNKNSKGNRKEGQKAKAKSLPGTLKQDKSGNGKGMSSNNPIHYSTSSLASGQVWQRHYKSKPQSPGLLTMIPPKEFTKEVVKLKKSDSSGRSTPKSVNQSGNAKKSSAIVARIQQLVQNGVKVMILMRGAPGSGKTHLAQVIVSLVTRNELSQHILSTDDYFIMLGRGNYAYDFNQLGQAHNWNQKRVSEALKRGINPVVVDNTNIQAWEMHPYVYLAVEYGYLVEVLEPVTPWRTKEAELARRNLHSVPREKIRQMLERYEPGWTGEKLIQSLGLKYKHGGSRSTQEKRPPPPATNSLLAQHRQHVVADVPEKPKRKKNGGKKKDRHAVAGIEITEDREKQLEELNKLFAEYGKKMDPVSKKKVLESGVPISEVVSRMRKLQGNILPLPKSNVPTTTPTATTTAAAAAATVAAPVPTITTTATTAAPEPERKPKPSTETNVIKPVPNYSGARVDSFSESFEPDTMSSSNASETSECETDTDAELPKWKEMRRYFEYGSHGHFVDGEDLLEDYDEEEERRPRSEGAVGGRKISKSQLTSSQEELSLIDFGTSVTHSSFSQDDLSLLNYDGTESADGKDSSSSSEEQETQMLTLQESLREALTQDTPSRSDDVSEDSIQESVKGGEGSGSGSSKPIEIELSESLMNAFNKRFEFADREPPQSGGVSINESLLQMLVKKYSNEDEGVEASVSDSKKSPDLEEVPLPSIPTEVKGSQQMRAGEKSDWCGSKRDKFEDIVNSWEHPSETVSKGDSEPKQARFVTTHSGAIRKTGIQRDKSPEEILKSAELSWSSIPFTSSWDDVSKKAAEGEAHAGSKPPRKLAHKSDSSTNTIHTDFDLWKKDGEGIVKLNTRSRNINQNYKEPVIPSSHVTDKLMLDKSSMTLDAEDVDVDVVGRDNAVDTLAGMFPGISGEHLSDILEKCQGNILWAIELLLESPQGFESLSNASGEDKPPSYSEAKAACESEAASLQSMIISDGKKTIKRRKDKKNATSELSLLLKKQIEDSIHINEDLYQDKTLFLKKLRHGKIEFGDEPIEASLLCNAGSSMAEGEGFAAKGPEMEDEEDEDDEDDEEEEEETIPMKIDPEFFKNLSKQFGSSNAAENEKQASLVPVINLPMSLAQQIYDCWLENVNRKLEEMQTDYDRMLKEDELLAGALQEQEFEFKQPDLREIMDMELAMLLYKQDQAQSSGTSRETLATKLSKQLLFETYPNLDKKMILDLFESEGNSFRKTVEILSARENESPATVIAPEFLAAHGNKLFEQVKSESLKKTVEKTRTPILILKQTSTKKESEEPKNILVVNPAEYRQKAVLLHEQRNECCRLAQEAFRKKSYSVASYFSHIASLYKGRIKELKKEPFSSTLFEDKANRMHTQVDLHFLYVSEALQMVDLFLDHHIKELRKKSSAEPLSLNLITGRGQHSTQGKSKIKPAVKKRLQQRLLSFVEPNPGMLKVTVRKNDLLSDEN